MVADKRFGKGGCGDKINMSKCGYTEQRRSREVEIPPREIKGASSKGRKPAGTIITQR